MGRERIILLTTVLGLIIGGMACYLLGKHFSDYTARTYVQVLPPLRVDPIASETGRPQKDIQYAYRYTMAHTIRSSRTFKELVGREAVRRTKWFRSFGEVAGEAADGAVEDLKRHLWTSAQRDSELVEIRMTCRGGEEAALIVNEVVDLIFEREDENRQDGTGMRLLEAERERVQARLSAIENDNRDLSPAQAVQRERIRKERISMLDAIDRRIEKTLQMRDQSQIKLKRVASAPVPVQARYPVWVFSCFPAGGILGFVFGLMFVSLSKRAEDKKDCSD